MIIALKQFRTTAGVVLTTGATLTALTMGIAPAKAALLDFNFSTINGASGSFTLNTSISDTNPTVGTGLFQNAITNVQYPLYGINLPESRNLTTITNGEVIVFELFDSTQTGAPYLDVYLDYENPDRLSSNPQDYFISQAGQFAGYGGLIGITNEPRFSRIIALNVTNKEDSKSVPEPGMLLGFFGLLGLGLLNKKQT